MPHPRLTFYCELEPDPLDALFGDPRVTADLIALGAGVSLALLDLSPARAATVQRLNQLGIEVVAWLLVPRDQGKFLNLYNALQAAARYERFKAWTDKHGLHWTGVGLDIESDVREMEQIVRNPGPVLWAWLRRSFDRRQYARGLSVYQDLVAAIRADGYRVETYQHPSLLDERKAGSTFFQRFFGAVDLEVDREVLMIYSNLLPPRGPGLLVSYGPEADAIAVGSTGDAEGSTAVLTWEEFRRDLLLASQWSQEVYAYSLEGCVRQGYLSRLRHFDWSAKVEVPPGSVRGASMMRAALGAALWTSEHPGLLLLAPLALGLRRMLRGGPAAQAAGTLVLAGSYHHLVRPRLQRWGATPAEARGPLPGDSLVERPRVQHTRAVTIQASASEVWPWLVQMGFRRGGYYYPGWIDAIWGWLIRSRYSHEPWYTHQSVMNVNANRIVPDFQTLAVGDRIDDGPDGYFEVRELIPNRALVLYSARHPLSGRPVDPKDPRGEEFVDFSWSFVLVPAGEGRCRLVVRLRADYTPSLLAHALVYSVIEPGDWVMQKLQLAGIKRRAERRRESGSATGDA